MDTMKVANPPASLQGALDRERSLECFNNMHSARTFEVPNGGRSVGASSIYALIHTLQR